MSSPTADDTGAAADRPATAAGAAEDSSTAAGAAEDPSTAVDAAEPEARRDPVTTGLRAVLDHIRPNRDGAVADYVPQLASADPDPFGIALVSMSGRKYAVGDCEQPFTIQSISKAFVYALAVSDHGMEAVLDRVGVEPSGEAFNAIKLEAGTGRPPNPMVNAGAMLTTSLVRAQYPEERLERIIACLSAFAGRRLEVDQDVAQSELDTASRNRALLYLMQGAGSLREPVEEVLSVYCQQCAISVTATDLAVMAATLANGGVNPVTGVHVVDEEVTVRTQAVMATCGMYDYSGEWLLRVGLPAKSGVAGGLIAVGPASFGIGTFSPRLDDRGNSVRGISVARTIADRFELHLMHHPGETAPVVYRQELLPPRAGRRGQTLVLGVQGVIEFGATEQALAVLEAAIDASTGEQPITGVIIDLHRVTQLRDLSNEMVRGRVKALLADGVAVAIVRRQNGYAQVPDHRRVEAFRDFGEALAWIQALPDVDA